MNQMDTNTEGNGPSQDPPQVLSPQDMDATTTNSKGSEKSGKGFSSVTKENWRNIWFVKGKYAVMGTLQRRLAEFGFDSKKTISQAEAYSDNDLNNGWNGHESTNTFQ
ncbi:hypothetical protein CDAR_272881 [Caerostris darwini]|uniref:Uncharacterized protein n=1 Tax=Caerostris darwini TaxID=1538125 RepID=A0AAV4MH45_9ARAC|nr:hypothetical protein CDAR_272881 [Caerostris darwini]